MQDSRETISQRRAARFVWGTALGASLLAAPLLIGAARAMGSTTGRIPEDGLLPNAVLAVWTALTIVAQVHLRRQRRRWIREDLPGLAQRIQDQLPVALALACLMPWVGSLSCVLGGMDGHPSSGAVVVAVVGMPLLAPLLVLTLVPRTRWFPEDLVLEAVPTLNPIVH